MSVLSTHRRPWFICGIAIFVLLHLSNLRISLTSTTTTTRIQHQILWGSLINDELDSNKTDNNTTVDSTTTKHGRESGLEATEIQRSSSNAADLDRSWSPACRPTWGNDPSKITRLYFAHTRKAGGTLLRAMLRKFTRLHNLTYASAEGGPVESPKRSDTLYVTNLRHPVSRVISHYKYEGRWSCRQTMMKPNTSIPTPENAQSLKSFVDSESSILGTTPPRIKSIPCSPSIPPTNRYLWVCAKNCYMRWYGKDFNCLRNVTDSFETAVENLSEFNLIVVVERLQDPVYWHGLTRMFGYPNSTRFRQSAYCDSESKFWNDKFPQVISNKSMAFVHQVNHRDIQLFHHLTQCRNQEVFPELPTVFSLGEP